jgi:type I restriction enzyme S subunit
MKKGWPRKRLSDLYHIGSSKRVLKSQWKTEGVPFYRGREVTRLAAAGFVDNELFISEKHFAELTKEYGVPKEGDIVITAIGTIGNSHVVRSSDRFYFKDASVLWMKRNAEVSSEFVNFWLKSSSFFDKLDRGNGATVDTLTIQKLQSVEISVPPLAEQQRLVGLLDEAFESLATAKTNAEKNLQNARALFESYLQSIFTQRGPGWVDRQLASLCHEITVGHVGSMKTEYKESGIPFLRSQNIRPFQVSMENAMFIDERFHHALKKSQLRPGDLAIVRTGYPGTAAVIPPELPDSNCSDLVIVRPSKEVNPHFLAAFFNSAFGKQLVLGKIVGAAQKHFNITAAKEV